MEEKSVPWAIMAVIIVIVIIFATIYFNLPGEETPDNIATVTFETDGEEIIFNCDVADNYTERQQGLMNVESLDPGNGMLFVFESPIEASFWMKDTLIPLDIIFVNETGYVVNIEEAEPEPDVPDALLTRYESLEPVIWVVEINQGICATRGIGPGSHVTIDD